MIARRDVVAGGLCACAAARAAAALPIPPSNALTFAIIRGDRRIGTHSVTFEPDGDKLTVRVAADIVVKFGPIALFRYHHRATEIWEGGVVVSVESKTNNDGKPAKTRMWRESGSLMVEGSSQRRYAAPPDASPATHWNRSMLDGPLIETEGGRLLRPKITPLGTAPIPGYPKPAAGFALRGDADLDTWYDTSPRWVGLRFTGKDGTEVRFEAV